MQITLIPESFDNFYWCAVGALAGLVAGVLLGRWIPRGRGGARRVEKIKSTGPVELYVGNLTYDVREDELRKMFEKYGRVDSARIITNRLNGKSKGYGFVSMPAPDEAGAAVNALNGKNVQGRELIVNEAKSRSR
jgi:RNA recognition motif-containing protein